MFGKIALIALISVLQNTIVAQDVATAEPDIAASDTESVVADSVASLHFWERGFIGKLYNYFSESNKERPEKRFDISFIGGPHYSSEQGFGLALVGSGWYRASTLSDTLTPYSNVSLKLDVSTGKMYEIGAEGFHVFKRDRFRINYDVTFYSFADKMWGIGYAENCVDSNECNYDRLQALAKADFVVRLKKNVFIGPIATFKYTNASHIDKPELLRGERTSIFNTGVGATFFLDTRNIPTAATRGLYIRLLGVVYPRFLANKYRYSEVELTTSAYQSVWKGAVLAENFHTRLTWGNTPWCQMSYFGGSKIMRGYWEERYRDKMESDVTIELRQRVIGRHGFAIWAGAGAVYPKLSQFKFEEILPNFGIGYRWEFKKGVNVRLDLGFGKHEKGINFSVNEAF